MGRGSRFIDICNVARLHLDGLAAEKQSGLAPGEKVLPYVLGCSVIAALLGTASAVRDEVTLGAIGHGAAHVHPPIDNRNHLYVLDGWGGIHPVGASPALASTASWPTKDIAYSLAL